jgi:DNA-binding transcriptional regulator YiaG
MDHEELFFVPGALYEGTETVLEAALEEAEAMARGWALLDHLPVTKIPKWRLIYQVRRIYEDPYTAKDEVSAVAVMAAHKVSQSLPLVCVQVADEILRRGQPIRFYREGELVTRAEVAQRLGVKPETVSKWRQRGERIGFPAPVRRGVWSVDDIDAWAKRTGRSLHKRLPTMPAKQRPARPRKKKVRPLSPWEVGAEKTLASAYLEPNDSGGYWISSQLR